jgi:hypothetical protein
MGAHNICISPKKSDELVSGTLSADKRGSLVGRERAGFALDDPREGLRECFTLRVECPWRVEMIEKQKREVSSHDTRWSNATKQGEMSRPRQPSAIGNVGETQVPPHLDVPP